MTFDEWINTILKGFRGQETCSPNRVKDLLSKTKHDELSEDEKKILKSVYQVTFQSFFVKAQNGKKYGREERIKEQFGKTLEENYHLHQGAFLKFAKTYWTFRIEVDDLYPQFSESLMSLMLRQIEIDISSVFFPTPGPKQIPLDKRIDAQKELLKDFAPNIDINDFFINNPILIKEKIRGDKWKIYLFILAIIAVFIFSFIFTFLQR